MIETLRELNRFVTELLTREGGNAPPLRDYLESMVSVVECVDAESSYGVFASIIERSFDVPEGASRKAWPLVDHPPDLDTDDGPFLVVAQLGFHISELERMKSDGILDQPPHLLYGGIVSPTGHSWYNFETAGFLESAMRGVMDCVGGDADDVVPDPDWRELAEIIDLGRMYE